MSLPEVHNLDDILRIVSAVPEIDAAAVAAADAREPQLTKPAGSLGRLEDLSRWLCGWQGAHPPRLDRVAVHIFAGNHGITAQGVSAFPSEVTVQMVANFEAGGAAINQLCEAHGAELRVIPLSLDVPTADFSVEPAMKDAELVDAFRTGWDTVEADLDLLCIGEMGIGNTTAAAAISHALYHGTAADWTGPGTGITGQGLDHKASVIAMAVDYHRTGMENGIEVLRHVGGRELAAMAGAIMAARILRVPVVLDGYVATAAAACLAACNPSALDHCQAGHVSREPGHRRLLERLGMAPLLDLDMRLGEGSGAAVAIGVIRSAVSCHCGMATFAEAGVSDKD